MTPSIRTFLLINLLLSATLITSLAIIGNLFFAHKDIQSQLDAQLIQTGQRIQAFLSEGIKGRNLSTIQKHLMAPKQRLKKEKGKFTPPTRYQKALEFQVWNKQGKLILHSAFTTDIPFSTGKSGLSTIWLGGHSWRVNTLYDKHNQLTIMVAERLDHRKQLVNNLTQDSILIMIITYPFLGFLIWIIVGRGLDTLKKVAEEVRHRAPSNLKPVGLESVPSEIEPLVEELNSLFRRLQEAFDRHIRFTADAAHELKTPLAALSTQVQVALRATTAEDRKEALHKVLTCVNRSTHVVQQLLTLSRMVPEANIVDSTRVNLAKQATDVAAQLAPQAITKNIELELLTPTSQASITGNATSINILLRNLLDNAIRYSPEQSTIKINIKETRNQVTLYVIDNGPGIPPELRERVFERFFRITGSKTTGSGLGLGIVQQIAKLHNADILLLTPRSGSGLEVQVIFPKSTNSR